MKGSSLVGTVVVAVIAFAAGWYLHQPGKGGEKGAALATQKKVVVLINGNKLCSQIYSGAGGFAKLPQLSMTNGDSVQWVKGVDKDGHDAQVEVTFPQTSNGHVGSPFTAGGAPKFVFTNGDDSGPPNGGPYDVYLYEKLKVGGIECTNPQDPGVIVDR